MSAGDFDFRSFLGSFAGLRMTPVGIATLAAAGSADGKSSAGKQNTHADANVGFVFKCSSPVYFEDCSSAW